VLHREPLTAEYPVTEVLRIAVPLHLRRVRLQVAEQAGALGNQAWILGIGSIRS